MVQGEDGAVAMKPPAPAASPQPVDTPTTPSSYLDWTSAMQALYGGGPAIPGTPPGFCPPSSSTPSPYVWGGQGANMATREMEAKTSEGSDQDLKKTSDNSLGNTAPVIRNHGDGDKASSGSANADPLGNAGLGTRSYGDSDKATSSSVNVDPSPSDDGGGEECSKNCRDDEINPCDFSISGKRSQDQLFPGPVKAASNPTATSLNIGMELWDSSHVNGQQNTVGFLPAGQTTVNGLNKAVPRNQITLDEREQKRQKRKLSNRESARRSRERKQKECEDLARHVAVLNTQNSDLRTEIDKLNMECKKLEAENTSIVEELKQLYGPSIVVATEGEKIRIPAVRTLAPECNGHSTEGNNVVPMVYQSTM